MGFFPSPDTLCEEFFWTPPTTSESLLELVRFIRENDNRTLIEKITTGPVSQAFLQNCGDGDTPLHRAIQYKAKFEVIEQIVRIEPYSVIMRNSERQTPGMILRDRLSSSCPVTREDLDILLLLEREQISLEN